MSRYPRPDGSVAKSSVGTASGLDSSPACRATRDQKLELIWRNTPPDHRRLFDGELCLVVYHAFSTPTLVPLMLLEDDEIERRLSLATEATAMG
jgi:hypothetical protein